MKRRLLNALRKFKHVPGLNRVVKPVVKYKVNKTIDAVASHFFEHFSLVVASEEDDVKTCFKARHEVYCEELGFEEKTKSKMEFDEFDEYSLSCYIKHRATGECAGTIRLVMPQHAGQLLPIESSCPEAIRLAEHSPSKFPRHSICEVSRLAIPKRFRRRAADKQLSPIGGTPNHKDGQMDKQLNRNFPYLSLALYFFAATICILRDIDNGYMMMEPRLARSLKFLGVRFHQLGHEVNYHGKRAAFLISPEDFVSQVSPALQKFQRSILRELQDVPNFGAIYHPLPAVAVKKQSSKQRKAA
ncbi:PEP-CTERM/exosortase system-associated acyltransferase [Alteromonas sp. ASW11-130]|uniref:PEP-CTERM/exosortase system-associated acyltransferase n=1 Tax=Alteromonas sp. ASW11-130 TaxID=3015775 RepID=UPI0022420F43|nr:PEP-CTERM/exosortase system-associated acyltransferase [Alteromonas sp. ASW11-130]